MTTIRESDSELLSSLGADGIMLPQIMAATPIYDSVLRDLMIDKNDLKPAGSNSAILEE